MGKLEDRLKKQIKSGIQIQDAESCIEIMEYLKSSNGGRAWESQWNTLVSVKLVGKYPYLRVYSPTPLGHKVLLGLEK
jgi:hypothetical protein